MLRIFFLHRHCIGWCRFSHSHTPTQNTFSRQTKWCEMLTFVCSMQCELGLWNCHTFMRRRRKKETWSNRFVCWWKSTFRTRKKIWKINLVMHWFWPGLVNESVWILFIAKQHDLELNFNQSSMLAYPLLWFFCISHVSVLFFCSFSFNQSSF